MYKNKTIFRAIEHACSGLVATLKTERNFRFHLLIMLAVISVAGYLQIRWDQWLFLTLAIGAVLIAELVNTAIERVVDLVTGQKHNEIAKQAKDIAASAVMIAAITAVVIGLIIFMPLLLAKI